METPGAVWGVLDAAMLDAGARCEVMAVGKGYRWGALESTCFRSRRTSCWAERRTGSGGVSAHRTFLRVAAPLTSEISSPYRMRLARRQKERRESWSSAPPPEHAVVTIRLPVSKTFYFLFLKKIFF